MSEAMEEMMSSLVKLQEINGRIEQLQSDRDALTVDVRKQEQTVAALQEKIEEAQAAVKQLQKDAGGRELEIKSLEEEIQALRVQLNQIRNQKEYDAIKHEIAGKEKKISEQEDVALEDFAKIDEARQALVEEQAALKEEEDRLAAIREEVSSETARLDEEIAALEGEREKLREQIDPQILDQYERLTANKSNPLVGVRDRICQGCFTLVPMQILNEVMRRDQLVFCHSCGRMLFLDESDDEF